MSGTRMERLTGFRERLRKAELLVSIVGDPTIIDNFERDVAHAVGLAHGAILRAMDLVTRDINDLERVKEQGASRRAFLETLSEQRSGIGEHQAEFEA